MGAFNMLRMMCVSMVCYDWTVARNSKTHFDMTVVSCGFLCG